MSDQEPGLVEAVGRAIYLRQRGALADQEGIAASRPWRSPDVPDIFWNGYLQDAEAALSEAGRQELPEVVRDFDMEKSRIPVEEWMTRPAALRDCIWGFMTAARTAQRTESGTVFVLQHLWRVMLAVDRVELDSPGPRLPMEATPEMLAVVIDPLLVVGDPSSSRVLHWRAALWRAMAAVAASAPPTADVSVSSLGADSLQGQARLRLLGVMSDWSVGKDPSEENLAFLVRMAALYLYPTAAQFMDPEQLA